MIALPNNSNYNEEEYLPEHIPIVSYDTQKEKEKEETRKIAAELRKKMGKKLTPIIITNDGQVKKATELTYEEQENEIIRCATNPIYFIETYLTIFDQTKGNGGMIVPFKLFSSQKELVETYQNERFVIANKYRQAGISTTTCAYIAWYVMFNHNRQVAIVADKLETARDELMSDVVNFIDSCPEWLKPKTGRLNDKFLKDTQKLKIYDNGSRLGAFSSKGLRGMTPTLLFWDETAWTEKGDKFWTSALPTLQTGGRAIMVSTPSGLDAVFYKTFIGARANENNFKAVELWWFNDPRYNKDLVWYKNKGKENEIKIIDNGWDSKKRIQLKDDGWVASSPWFELQVRNANGDMKKIAQEILCVFGDAVVTVKNINSKMVETLRIEDLYHKIYKQNCVEIEHYSDFKIALNFEYEILNSSGNFVNFWGVNRLKKDGGYKVTLENGMSITVSKDHIFLANGKNMYVSSLLPNISYLTTINGDFYVSSIEPANNLEFFDIVDSDNCDFFANGISNHNCSFLGSGDNFIAEKYLKKIEEDEIMPPIRQEYTDLNFWIWEDPQIGETYIMAIDASPGHGDDNSTINMLKISEIIEEKVIIKNDKPKKVKIKKYKVEQVAEYYGKVVPQMLAEIAYQFGKRYNNAYCIVDITGGYGIQTVEKLLESGYENMHYAEVTHKPSRDMLQGYIKRGQKKMPDGTIINVDLIPGFFIGNNRASVLLELQRAIHMGDITIRSVRLLNELKTFVTVAGNRVADHKRSFHDDSIMGLAIGLFTLNFEMVKFKQDDEITKKILNAIITNNDLSEIEKKQNLNNKWTIPSNDNNMMNPYNTYQWLFDGMKK